MCPIAGGGCSSVLDIEWLRAPSRCRIGITGPSDAVNTALLRVLAGLQHPQRGTIRWGPTTITDLCDSERDRWRRHSVGTILQDFLPLPGATALEQVLWVAPFDRRRVPFAFRERARALLVRVGLSCGPTPVDALSRGELRRVAIARALLFSPSILLADEPTLGLDAENGRAITDLVLDLCRESGATLVVVSRDDSLLHRLDEVFKMADPVAIAQPDHLPSLCGSSAAGLGGRNCPRLAWTASAYSLLENKAFREMGSV